MSVASGGLAGVLDALGRAGLPTAEVYWKRGRSRRLELGLEGRRVTFSREEGWAVRAGDERRSVFAAATGAPRPEGPWPEADGHPLSLPAPPFETERSAWRDSPEIDAPLIAERDGFVLLEAIARELEKELPGARMVAAVMDDGASEVEVASTRGVSAATRHRLAYVRVQATIGGQQPATAVLELALREARRLEPLRVARRLANRLHVVRYGRRVERDRADLILAPGVGARLLAGLLPLLLGPGGAVIASALTERRGRLGHEALSVLDDGRFPGGLLASPVDGEGLPTRAVTLIERGTYRQPLLTHREAAGVEGARGAGCNRRASWRELPQPGPSHLFIAPALGVSPGALVAAAHRGYYLFEVEGIPRFDFAADRLAVPVSGYVVAEGRASLPIAGAWMVGSISGFLRGVTAVARDLSFEPLAGGLVGSPTLRVSGLELRPEPT